MVEGPSTPKRWYMLWDYTRNSSNTIKVSYQEMNCVHIHTTGSATRPERGGTLIQTFNADRYRNKRMRFSALVKSEAVEEWAGLWMRIDGKCGEVIGFDNMEKRKIKGTLDWQRYFVVLDVPQGSNLINFGISLHGKGDVWMADARFEETTDTVTGAGIYPDEPGNLDFSEV
jgi:hypothetical protein